MNYIRRTLFCWLGFVMLSSSCLAQSFNEARFKMRAGLGDMLFETLVWHNQPHSSYNLAPDGILFKENNHYHHTPHFNVDFSYNALPWMDVNVMVDFQSTWWHCEKYDNKSLVSFSKENFFNLCMMPGVRFKYFRRDRLSLYSSLNVGIDINGGTEKNIKGNKVVAGAAADVRLIGVSYGPERLRGYAELGGIYALKNKDNMFLMNSEIIRIGISYAL